MTFPARRPRRLRVNAAMRDMVAETRVSPNSLLMPHFVLDGRNRREAIEAMPGIERLSTDLLLRQVEADRELGITRVLLFGVPSAGGDAMATAAYEGDPLVTGAVRELKRAFGGDVTVVTDVCLCAYTEHGHCGVLAPGASGADAAIDNDRTLPLLARMALSHAHAGADIVSPSDMMDGRVAAIRAALDTEGLGATAILSYTAKFASAYYGPFREAAHSAPAFGDRRTYQMDPRNVREAVREAALDEEEGADMLMVKPALAYLDVIRALAEVSELPIAAYNVSGEYSQVKAAAARGWLDEAGIVRENLLAMARAGADIVITYHARDALRGGWLA
jgi:porphobilinogen synthase